MYDDGDTFPPDQPRADATPAVSICMPVYNAEPYLAEAVDSILAQSLRDFELIVIDDGSTDGSLGILERYAARDSRITLRTRENRGLIGTLNEMLEMARGPFVARMDADDIAAPDRLALQHTFLLAHPECVAVSCGVALCDEDGITYVRYPGGKSHERLDSLHLLGRGNALCHAAAMFRRNALSAVGGYRPAYRHAEDFDLFLRLAEHGRLAELTEVLYTIRQHPKSVSKVYRLEQIANTHAALRDACRRRGIPAPCLEPAEGLVASEEWSRLTARQRYAWQAHRAGLHRNAQRLALKAWLSAPWAPASYAMLAVALSGPAENRLRAILHEWLGS